MTGVEPPGAGDRPGTVAPDGAGDDPTAGAGGPSDTSGAGSPAASTRTPRPMIERLGLAAIALLLAIMFGGVAAASWVGGEPFLAVMGGVGCLMTIWVGLLTLVRG